MGKHLQACPYAGALPYHVNDSELEWLYTDYPFNWSQQLALYNLGDAGIIADVHRYHSSYLKLQMMRGENERLSKILTYAQGELDAHNREVESFLKEVTLLRARLIDAKALSRLAPIVQRLSIQGHIPDPFLPQTVQAVSTEDKRPPTPRPPLHTTNPDPPSVPSAPMQPSNPVPVASPRFLLILSPHTKYGARNTHLHSRNPQPRTHTYPRTLTHTESYGLHRRSFTRTPPPTYPL